VIPTLRCNLACSYCQVARAPEGAPGFDWSDEMVERYEARIGEALLAELDHALDDVEAQSRLAALKLNLDAGVPLETRRNGDGHGRQKSASQPSVN
jgi:wyosine [tRNA(Phe)-imidazoG37] synthetase (radical SAM superfamily)